MLAYIYVRRHEMSTRFIFIAFAFLAFSLCRSSWSMSTFKVAFKNVCAELKKPTSDWRIFFFEAIAESYYKGFSEAVKYSHRFRKMQMTRGCLEMCNEISFSYKVKEEKIALCTCLCSHKKIRTMSHHILKIREHLKVEVSHFLIENPSSLPW